MLAKRMMTPRILWGALLFSTLLIGVMPYVATLPDQPPNRTMLPVFCGMALFQVVFGLVFPETTLKKALATRLAKSIVERPNPAAEVTFREAAPPIKAFDDPNAIWPTVLLVWQTPFILKMALAESVALMGLMLPFQGFPRETALPFVAVAAMLQIARFPTAAKIQRAVLAATGVELPLPT